MRLSAPAVAVNAVVGVASQLAHLHALAVAAIVVGWRILLCICIMPFLER